MFRPISEHTGGNRWVPAKNESGGAAPAFALVRVTGNESDGSFSFSQPNADGQHVWVNSPLPSPADDTASVTNDYPAWAHYDTADGTPAVGEVWGAGNGSWKLRKGKAGFRICGDPDTTLQIVPVELMAGGRLRVREVDGSPSVHPVDVLEFHQDDGFVVSDQGNATARVRLSTPYANPHYDFAHTPSTFNITTDDTWENNSGEVQVGLPVAGDYLLDFGVEAVIDVDDFGASIGASIQVRLWDATDGAEVPGSHWLPAVRYPPHTDDPLIGHASAPVVYSAPNASTVVRMEYKRSTVNAYNVSRVGRRNLTAVYLGPT